MQQQRVSLTDNTDSSVCCFHFLSLPPPPIPPSINLTGVVHARCCLSVLISIGYRIRSISIQLCWAGKASCSCTGREYASTTRIHIPVGRNSSIIRFTISNRVLITASGFSWLAVSSLMFAISKKANQTLRQTGESSSIYLIIYVFLIPNSYRDSSIF